uniref:RNA polymerase sigma factor n=1 Tax=Pedobacter schmidteae TaxID=2201271 RepID=UPI000EB12C2C|nr:sigma-70 family RNA polymerase sigma factor [Pedobacter schmidteae]
MTDYSTLTDEQLIALLRKGDGGVFNAIFAKYRNFLFSFTYRRLNDKELARDLIHDVFSAIWEKRATINIPGNIESFLVVMIKNKILDHYKHQKVSQRYIDSLNVYIKIEEEAADHRVRHNDLAAMIEQEVAALPPKMRIVFELSRKQYMNRQEISEYLDVPQESVKTSLRRALNILKTKLKVV